MTSSAISLVDTFGLHGGDVVASRGLVDVLEDFDPLLALRSLLLIPSRRFLMPSLILVKILSSFSRKGDVSTGDVLVLWVTATSGDVCVFGDARDDEEKFSSWVVSGIMSVSRLGGSSLDGSTLEYCGGGVMTRIELSTTASKPECSERAMATNAGLLSYCWPSLGGVS